MVACSIVPSGLLKIIIFGLEMDKNIVFKLKEGGEYIPLIQLLKAVQVVGSGGEAQMIVMNSQVTLNGETEHRKRAKVRAGNVVTALGFVINVIA